MRSASPTPPPSDTTWTAPYVLPVTGANNLSLDDIATLVAYKDTNSATRRIGVLWSNESAGAANGLYFASHVDGAGDTAASWAGTRLCADTLCPDDHLNIKSIDADASGNLYAAVKTSKNDASTPNPDDPLIVVYRLNLNGTWTHSTAWEVKDDVTRVIILLDSTNHEAHLFGAGPCCSGGTVYTKNPAGDTRLRRRHRHAVHQARWTPRSTTPPRPSRPSTAARACSSWPATTAPGSTCTTT